MRNSWSVVVALVCFGCSPFTKTDGPPTAPPAAPPDGQPVAVIGTPPVGPTPPTSAEGDRDGDTISDANDRCPDAAEVVNNFEDADGCPDQAPAGSSTNPPANPPANPPTNPAVLPGLLGKVEFDAKSAALTTSGKAQVDRVAAAMRDSSTMRLAVVGHTQASESRKLGLERAESVRDALVAAGVDGARLEVRNVGADQPAGGSEEKNRRVEFKELSP